jgi:hypothetical protein
MAVRSSMAALITRVRQLIGDPAGGSQTFDDQTIQNALDHYRNDYRYEMLRGVQTFSGSNVLYLDYYAADGDWEADATLYQFRTTLVTPATSDYQVGHWVFAATTLPPVYLIGQQYDPYGAACEMIDMRIALSTLQFDFTSDGQSFHLSQISAQLQKMKDLYLARMRPRIVTTYRSDANQAADLSIGPNGLDYMGSGDGR